MVLTDKKKLLSRYFSRLPRESLYTAQVLVFACLHLMKTRLAATPKTTVSA